MKGKQGFASMDAEKQKVIAAVEGVQHIKKAQLISGHLKKLQPPEEKVEEIDLIGKGVAA